MTDHIVVGIKRDTAVFQCLIKNNNIGQMQQNMHGSSLSNGYDFKISHQNRNRMVLRCLLRYT